MSNADLAKTIDEAFEKRDGITPKTKGSVRKAVESALDLLDEGKLRVAEKQPGGRWAVCAGRVMIRSTSRRTTSSASKSTASRNAHGGPSDVSTWGCL